MGRGKAGDFAGAGCRVRLDPLGAKAKKIAFFEKTKKSKSRFFKGLFFYYIEIKGFLFLAITAKPDFD